MALTSCHSPFPPDPQSPGTQADEEDGLGLDTVSTRPKTLIA